MKNTSMAETYFEQAGARIQTARRAFKTRNYAFVVRQSQECVELSLKAALRLFGVEYPREHDVSKILSRLESRFPRWFGMKLEELGKISAELARHRGASMYGDEEKGIPPSELFKREDGRRALEGVKLVYKQCGRLLSEFRRARGR